MESDRSQQQNGLTRPGNLEEAAGTRALFGGLRFGLFCLFLLFSPSAYAIMAGGEFDLPADFPSNRIDPLAATSPYNFVGGLEIAVNTNQFFGSAVALSPNWVLTAGHNVDTNDDGQPDVGLAADFHLPGFGSYGADSFLTHPGFSGFGNPSIQNDLALLYFAEPLPRALSFPALGMRMEVGDTLALVGFGRSGFGSYGYTTQAGVDDRRIGYNTVESFETADSGSGSLFRYTFDAPEDADSLGNDLESLIGPGDSGGPALTEWGDVHALVGINTFTEGLGGHFGDIGGGVHLEDYWSWIHESTGLTLVPEPRSFALWAGCLSLLFIVLRNRR